MEERKEEYSRSVVNRFSRAIGHLRKVKKMVEQGSDCAEVLMQLAAVRSAVNGVGKEILKQYIEESVREEGTRNPEALKKLSKSFDQIL